MQGARESQNKGERGKVTGKQPPIAATRETEKRKPFKKKKHIK